MMRETVLFSFGGVDLAPPHSPSAPGLLVLTSSSQPTEWDPSRFDIFLRLQHTPQDSAASHPTDVLIEAWRELRKTSPREFLLASEFGDLTISFPELNLLIPEFAVGGALDDLPAEAKREMTWEAVVRAFEGEVDRFVSYQKNSYSLINSPFDDRAYPVEKPKKAPSVSSSGKSRKGGVSPDRTGASGYSSSSKAKAREAGYSLYGDNEGPIKPYNPSTYSDEKRGGRLVLVDEENGNEVGETQVNSIGVIPGSKDPVEITFPEDGTSGPVTVRTADYLKDAMDPAYQNSSLVQTAATVSRLIITTSAYLSNAMSSGARSYSEKTVPRETPMTFQPSTHQRFQQIHTLSATAAKFSSATVGKVSTMAQNAGAKLAGKDKPSNERGQPRNPNILNKSLIAFSTVADSIDYASKSLLTSSSQAATHIVAHKYGAEAGEVAKTLTGSFKNVGLVYIDASGVSRRAVVKGVAKGMVVGKVKGGGEVMVPVSSGNGYNGDGYAPARIDGLPSGWGDGPLGGANAGPPSGRQTPVQTPPPYNPNSYTDTPNLGGGSNSLYFSPPPGREGSPAPRPLMQRQSSGKGEFRY